MITFTPTGLVISETLLVNSIVWIHSLPDSEMGPSRRILDDLDGLKQAGGFQVLEYRVRNRSELIDVFHRLCQAARDGLRPILHVDAHGTSDEGLLLAPSGERVGWEETISFLRELNVATENNLVCVFALCFGLHVYMETRLKEPVPAYFFGAPASEITVGFLEDQTLAFYQETLRTGNVTAAFHSTLGAQMRSFHCHGLFLETLAKYVETHCTSKVRLQRTEQLLSEVLKRDGITSPTPVQLRTARAEVKALLTPGQAMIDLFAPRFLIGRASAFDYSQLREFIERRAATR